MRIEVQVDINEIIWEDDPYGFFSREWGSTRSFSVEMWESESLREIIKYRLEKETGRIPESWSFQKCLVIRELV
jgi:hypothetical protein